MTRAVRRAVRRHGQYSYYCCCYCWIGVFWCWSFFYARSAHSLQDLYARARHTRIRDGHAAAQPLYADLLRRQQEDGKGDLTTSTRLAASTGELLRCWQNAGCGVCWHDPGVQHSAADRRRMEDALSQLRAWFLDFQYTTRGVGTVLNIPVHQATARAPVYVSPAAAGTVHQDNYPFPLLVRGSAPAAALQCLVALFLLGLAVPERFANAACSPSKLQLLYDMGLVAHCDYDPTLLVAVVSIMPVDLTTMPSTNAERASNANNETARNASIFIVTDWHPRVLNTIQITADEEAVMYIGPDSLALVQHWLLQHPENAARLDDHDNVTTRTCGLDLCTGSGIQALVALTLKKCQSMVCLDLNPRALRFTAFSAALNGLLKLSDDDDDNNDNALTLVQGNLLDGTGRVVSVLGHSTALSSVSSPNVALVNLLSNLLESSSATANIGAGYNMITANPPFLPVPSPSAASAINPTDTDAATNEMIAARHGLFSAGGSSGEAVLAAILALSRRLLKPNGYVAIVSEFFFSPTTNDRNSSDILLDRLKAYWSAPYSASCTTPSPASCKALLLTNQYPISAQLYAERRADSLNEVTMWVEHLRREHIASCSPGLLYIQKTSEAQESVWHHVIVPKSERGSIWTPSNPDAVLLTQAASASFFQWRTSI